MTITADQLDWTHIGAVVTLTINGKQHLITGTLQSFESDKVTVSGSGYHRTSAIHVEVHGR